MDQQVVRWTNTAAQDTQINQRVYEQLLSKSNECNTLALQIRKLEQENASFRLQLQLQRAPANYGSVEGTLEARIQTANNAMSEYIALLRKQLDSKEKKIQKQQEAIEGLRDQIRHARDVLST